MTDKEILEAMRSMLEPVQTNINGLNTRLDIIQADITELKVGQLTMQYDIDQIKEDTAITRETANGLGEWAEIAAAVLKIKYPVNR